MEIQSGVPRLGRRRFLQLSIATVVGASGLGMPARSARADASSTTSGALTATQLATLGALIETACPELPPGGQAVVGARDALSADQAQREAGSRRAVLAVLDALAGNVPGGSFAALDRDGRVGLLDDWRTTAPPLPRADPLDDHIAARTAAVGRGLISAGCDPEADGPCPPPAPSSARTPGTDPAASSSDPAPPSAVASAVLADAAVVLGLSAVYVGHAPDSDLITATP
jgi:hypothetical protein